MPAPASPPRPVQDPDRPAVATPPSAASGGQRGRTFALALLIAINMFNYIDRYILAAVEPKVREDLLAHDPDAKTKMGLLATAFMVSYMVLAPIFGWLGDRTRRWIIIGVGVSLWSLASGASGLATVFWALLLTRVFVGVGEAAWGPTAPTLLADLYPVERRGIILAWFNLALPVGSAIGYGFGGLIASKLSWHWAFYLVVPPGLLLGVLALLRREPARGTSDPGSALARPVTRRDYAVLLRTPSYIFNTLGMTAMTFAVGGISFWMPTYIHEYRGQTDLAAVNLTFGGITVVAGFLATLTGGWLADKLRTRVPGSYFLVSGAGMLLGFPLFLGVLWTPFPLAWVFMFLAIVCLFLNTGPSNTITANITHPAIRSTAFALTILCIHILGDAISPWIIGRVADLTVDAAHPRGNMNTAFLAVGGAILLSGVLWVLGSRHLKRDTERAPRSLAR